MDSGWSVNGEPVELGDDYTDMVTHFRIFDEGDGWALDGADDLGHYTPAIWKYDTHAEAVAHLQEFYEFLRDEGYKFRQRRPRIRVYKRAPEPDGHIFDSHGMLKTRPWTVGPVPGDSRKTCYETWEDAMNWAAMPAERREQILEIEALLEPSW